MNEDFKQFISKQNRFFSAATFIGLIWLVSLLELSGLTFNLIPKLLPRSVTGILGIFSMPFLHGSIFHLLSNTLPMIVFSFLLSLKGNMYYLRVTILIIIISGIMLWFMGRGSYHIGASGLVFGYFGFIMMRTYYSPSVTTIAIALGVLMLYGGLIFGILPRSGPISWEGHLFGLIAGVIVARLGKNKALSDGS